MLEPNSAIPGSGREAESMQATRPYHAKQVTKEDIQQYVAQY